MNRVLKSLDRIVHRCLNSPRILMASVIGLVIGYLVVLSSWSWEKRSIPSRIATSKVLISQQKAGGFTDGCVFAALSLTPESVRAIESQGLKYFVDMPQPPGGQSTNPYGDWQATPAPARLPVEMLGSHVDLSYARSIVTDGCNNDDQGEIHGVVGKDPLGDPGNFYAITKNKEGIIVVAPRQNIVIFAYFG